MSSGLLTSDTNYTTTTTKTPTANTNTRSAVSPFDDKKSSSRQEEILLQRNNSNNSYCQRDSRVQSIYDLYRQESIKQTNKSHKILTSIQEMLPSSSASSQAAAAFKKKGGGIDKHRESRPENSAWAGMMMGNVSSDESDSDDSDHEALSKNNKYSNGPAGMKESSRASWSSRAVAVGSRPPDSASQNPPTLKLLGLKSVKDGGAAIGHGARLQVEPQQGRTISPAFDMIPDQAQKDRIISTSDYGDDVDRHGSYIEFGGAADNLRVSNTRGYELRDGPVKPSTTSSSLEAPKSAAMRDGSISPRTALTQQLGLFTPQPSPPQDPKRLVGQQQTNGDYFTPMRSPINSSPTRNLTSPGQGMQQGSAPPQDHSRGISSSSIPLQRGQQPGYQASNQSIQPSMMTPMRSGPAPAPMPIPLPSPVYPPPNGSMMNNGPPSYQTGRPSQDSRMGPGFSDTPQVGGRQMARQPSLLRRSMAFLTGSGPTPSQQHQQQRLQQNGGNGQRKSLFRKSMAILTGRSMPPFQETPSIIDDGSDSPLPRVAGFIDEKPKNRKSEYLGASGMGDEWDYGGYGAKFWKRFSTAQRKAMEGGSKENEAFARKLARQRKRIMLLSLLGGLAIIGAVVGIIIWRESVGSSEDPGAVDRTYNGISANSASAGYDVNSEGSTVTPDTTYVSQTVSSNEDAVATTAAADAATTTTRHHRHHGGNRRRSVMTTFLPLVEDIKRDMEDSSPSYFGGIHPLPRGLDGEMIRKRKQSNMILDARSTPAPQAIKK